VKLSLMIPTFRSAETIERTLTAALAQRHRPLEVLVYDEASLDGTREIVASLLASADPTIETRLLTSDVNSGAVPAWRVLLHEVTGDWCCFVWADDVLKPEFSERMIEGAERASPAGRVLVGCSAEVEAGGQTVPYYPADSGVVTATEYSEGMFLRRIPLTQICAVYETAAARVVFDRHIQIENPRGYDYVRHPYGNDVGFLSELAMEGGGVELLGERLVTLVDSSTSMTRQGTSEHVWQMRWQYTFASRRVWAWWAERRVPGAERLLAMADRRLALCSLRLDGSIGLLKVWRYPTAARSYLDFRRLDYQLNRTTLHQHRTLVARRD
jgi:glycosyltransferase involved in cell wall biosynthesis